MFLLSKEKELFELPNEYCIGVLKSKIKFYDVDSDIFNLSEYSSETLKYLIHYLTSIYKNKKYNWYVENINQSIINELIHISDYLLLEVKLQNPLIIYFREQIHCSHYSSSQINVIIQRIDEILDTFKITECKYHLQCVCILSILTPIYNVIKNSLFPNNNCTCYGNCNTFYDDCDCHCSCRCHCTLDPRNGRYGNDLIWYGLHKYLLTNGFTINSANEYLIFRQNEPKVRMYTSIELEFEYTMFKCYKNEYKSKYSLY